MTDQELKAVKLDLSTVHFILTRLEQGSCRTDRPALINECNRRAHFEEKLRNVLYAWDIKDQLVFYFSGHEDIRKNHLYCLKIGLKDSHWYPFNNLMNDVSAEEFQRTILVLDIWHNSAIIPGIKNSNDSISNIKESMENSKIPKVIAMITSSQKAQKSHELSYRSYSVFTDLFCNPIQTSLDENGTNYGHIYIKQIFEYINKNLQTDKQYSNFKFKQPSDFYIDKVEAEEKI